MLFHFNPSEGERQQHFVGKNFAVGALEVSTYLGPEITEYIVTYSAQNT